MIFLPFRAKNPPERFPYVTIGLITVNVFVYALTSEYFLVIRESAVYAGAISHNTFNPVRMLTSIFLHADIMHLLGNMLFLWIFGSAAEGRLGYARYLAVYLFCGAAGTIAHELTFGLASPEQFGLGASGAIMGLAGAYIYMFPFATICIFFAGSLGWRFFLRILEWQAQWVVLYYIGFDILNALLFQGGDGIAHLAHIGGFGAGFLAVMALRARRDSEYVSEAQKLRAEIGGDFSLMPFHELEALMEQPNGNVSLIMAYVQKALRQPGGSYNKLALDTIRKHSQVLIEGAEPGLLAVAVLQIPVETGTLPLPFYLRLGSRLERTDQAEIAKRCYQRIYLIDPSAVDTEMALFRWGGILERAGARGEASAVFTEMLTRFPSGAMAMQGSDAVRRLGPPTELAFSAGEVVNKEKPGPQAFGLNAVQRTPFPTEAAAPAVARADTSDMAPLGNTPRPSAPIAPPPPPVYSDPGDDLRPIGSGR